MNTGKPKKRRIAVRPQDAATVQRIHRLLKTLPWKDAKYHIHARQQGWDLFEREGFIGIEALDDPEGVAEDEDIPTQRLVGDWNALITVLKNARRGDTICRIALLWHNQPAPRKRARPEIAADVRRRYDGASRPKRASAHGAKGK